MLEISEPTELIPNKEVRFMVKREAPVIFYFEVTEKSKITIDSWEIDEDKYSHTNIFVTANDENVSSENFHWKSQLGVGKIDVYPERPDFKIGTYRVSI